MKNPAAFNLWVGLLIISFGLIWVGTLVSILKLFRDQFNKFKKGYDVSWNDPHIFAINFIMGKEIESRMFRFGLLGFIIWCAASPLIDLYFR